MTVDNSQLSSSGNQIPQQQQPESFADLWDGYENVTKATEKGVLLLKDIIKFFKKRIQSEDEYSKNLSKLVLKFEPMAPDGFIGSRLKNTWDQIRLETLTHSNYHENICSNLSTHIIEPIEGLIVDLEQKLKTIHLDAEKSFIHYQESVAKLKKAKQNYDKLCKDSFEITGVSKGETQKVQKRAIKAAQDVIKADKEYRAQINETNTSQKQFLTELIPKIMNDLQRLEMVRIHMVKSYFLRYFKAMDSVKFGTEIDNLLSLINNINNEDEIQEYIRKSKTTHKYPKPFEYEPYLDRFSSSSSSSSSSSNSSPQISSPQLLSPRDNFHHSSSSGSLPLFTSSTHYQQQQQQQAQQTQSNSITNSLSLSSDNLQNNNSNNNNTNVTPTKEKKPSSWGLKRFSTSISSNDRKLLHKQIQAIGQAHNGGNVFNNKIEDIMASQKKKYPLLEIPFIVVFLKQKLIALDVYKTQGIFRVPGNVVDINSLKKRFDDGNYEVAQNENVYTVASLLKLWLREITEPLFPPSVYETCVEKCNNKEQVRQLVASLPILNQRIISYIVEMLQEAGRPENVEHSKMDTSNLSMVFSPCFLRATSTDPNVLLGNIFKEKEFVKNLIDGLVPLVVNDSLEGPSTSSTSINQNAIDSPPSSPYKPANNNNNINKSSNNIPIKSSNSNITTNTTTTTTSTTKLSPIVEQSPVKQQPALTLTQTQSHLNIPGVLQQNNNNNQPSSLSTPSTPLSAVNPKINQIKAESITTPQKSTDGSSSTALHLMSPSEVKKRSNAVYLEEQESCKQRIDEIHTQINELYSDITTIETTTYFAMQSSLSITKFTQSLESFLTVEMWNLTLSDIKEAIEKNKFVSPPPLNFKIPSKMPKLSTPIELVQNESCSELLRKWLVNVTLTVNRVNEYLCYLGGVVIRIHSPELLSSINNLFLDLDIIPQQNPKFSSLTLEQSTLFIQKTISLLEPLTPFTEEELNINIKVQNTITPASLSPALLSEPDDSNVCNSPTTLDDTLSSSINSTTTTTTTTTTNTDIKSPSILVTNSNNQVIINQPTSTTTTGVPPSTTTTTTTGLLSPSSSTTSFKIEDDLEDEELDETQDLLELNNQLHNQLKNEELKRKQQQTEYKQLVFDIIDMMKDKKNLINTMDLSDSDSQNVIKSIAKLSLTLKRSLDDFILESNIEIDGEVDPIINKENDSFVNLKLMTNHFLNRILTILKSYLVRTSNEYNSTLYELLLPYKNE